MALTTAQIQQAYVTFFSRPADPVGLAYWQAYTGSVADLYATFAQQTEYSAAFSGLTSAQKVNVVYQNLFGRDAEATGLLYWAGKVESGAITVANLALAVSAGSQGTDLDTVNSRVSAATSFSAALDTPAEILGYTGATANAAAKTWLAGVKTAANLATAVAAIDTATAAVVAVGGAAGSTFTLTTGVDTITGTGATDTINAVLSSTAAANTLNAFDSIDGGTGTDTLNISASQGSNFTLPAAATFKNLEAVNVSQVANGGTGTGALTVTNTTFGAGVQKFTYTDASLAADMTAAAVSVTLNNATDVAVSAVGTGTFTTVAVTDTSTTAASTGSLLKNISVTKASGNLTLTGNGISTVNLNAVGGATTITAAAGTRALAINASGTTTQGAVTDAEATSAVVTVSGAQTLGLVTVAKATTATINTNAAATTSIAAAKATTLNFGGTNLNTLTIDAATVAATSVVITGAGGVAADLTPITALTSVDTTGSSAAAPASGVLTGANTLTIGTGVAYNGGAGQDIVTVGATTKAVALGAGDDTAVVSVTALGTGGSIAGGDGTDTLKLSNANAVTLSTAGAVQTAFKAAVTGFEILDITTAAASTVNVAAVGTFSTVKMNNADVAQVLSGVTSGQTINLVYAAAAGTAGSGITTNTLTGANDSLTLKLSGDLSGGARNFGDTIALAGVETVNIQMADTNATFTTRLATATIVDANAQQIIVTGNNGLALTHAGTALYNLDASGLTKGSVTFTAGALTTDATVKGSATGGDTLNFAAALGKVTITATAGTNALTGSSTVASTITGGSGNDTIVGGTGKDVIVAGAGTTANTITGGAAADTIDLTGSAGADTMVFGVASTSVSSTGANVDVITNFTSGVDKIQLTAGNNSATTTTVSAGGLAGINLAAGSTLATMNAVITDATSVATVADVYTALATDLNNVGAAGAFAASATGAGNVVAREVTFTTGAAAGTYLVINDVTAGFQAATDLVVKLVGTTAFAASDLTVV